MSRKIDHVLSTAVELEPFVVSIADGEVADWENKVGQHGIDAGAAEALHALANISRAFRLRKDALDKVRQCKVAFQFAGLDVIKKIGEGGQGEVWLAHDPGLNQKVALKLRENRGETLPCSLMEEGRKLARINHSNVVRVYGAAIENGNVGIWMELVNGESLHERVSRHGALELNEVIAVARDVCGALAAVHRQGFVHADVKPKNILRDVDGRAVLVDFGSARGFNDVMLSTVTGTRAFIAPEILDGAATTPASDIYALAKVMFYLITAQLPRCANAHCCSSHRSREESRSVKELETPRERGACSRRGRVKEVAPHVPDGLASLIERGMSVDPCGRPQSAAQFYVELESASQFK